MGRRTKNGDHRGSKLTYINEAGIFDVTDCDACTVNRKLISLDIRVAVARKLHALHSVNTSLGLVHLCDQPSIKAVECAQRSLASYSHRECAGMYSTNTVSYYVSFITASRPTEIR